MSSGNRCSVINSRFGSTTKRSWWLLQAAHLVAALLQHLEHRILAGEMAGADRNHDRSRLRQPVLDPFRPIGVALLKQGLPHFRGFGEFAVESACDSLDVSARPGRKHSAEFLVHARNRLDRAFK